MNRMLLMGEEPTLKDKIYGAMCPKCKRRTGRDKILPVYRFVCPRCNIEIYFSGENNKNLMTDIKRRNKRLDS
jgi:hypothetical protein